MICLPTSLQASFFFQAFSNYVNLVPTWSKPLSSWPGSVQLPPNWPPAVWRRKLKPCYSATWDLPVVAHLTQSKARLLLMTSRFLLICDPLVPSTSTPWPPERSWDLLDSPTLPVSLLPVSLPTVIFLRKRPGNFHLSFGSLFRLHPLGEIPLASLSKILTPHAHGSLCLPSLFIFFSLGLTMV